MNLYTIEVTHTETDRKREIPVDRRAVAFEDHATLCTQTLAGRRERREAHDLGL